MSTADWLRHHDLSPYCYRSYPMLHDNKEHRDVCPCGWVSPKDPPPVEDNWWVWDDKEQNELDDSKWAERYDGSESLEERKPCVSFTMGELISHHIRYYSAHSKGGFLCKDGDCLAHCGGHHTEACIVRDSEGIAVDHDSDVCECG